MPGSDSLPRNRQSDCLVWVWSSSLPLPLPLPCSYHPHPVVVLGKSLTFGFLIL